MDDEELGFVGVCEHRLHRRLGGQQHRGREDKLLPSPSAGGILRVVQRGELPQEQLHGLRLRPEARLIAAAFTIGLSCAVASSRA